MTISILEKREIVRDAVQGSGGSLKGQALGPKTSSLVPDLMPVRHLKH